jgi:hypothetical protein
MQNVLQKNTLVSHGGNCSVPEPLITWANGQGQRERTILFFFILNIAACEVYRKESSIIMLFYLFIFCGTGVLHSGLHAC